MFIFSLHEQVAREEFNEAVAQQQVAALLEEHTPEIFETKLGNIPARTSIKVEIVYVNELKADIEGEGVLVSLPTSIAPRYGIPPPQMSASSAIDKNGLHITVHVHASEPLRKLESRTHPIAVEMGTADIGGIPAAVSTFGELLDATERRDNKFDPKKAKATLSERHATLGCDFILLILTSGSNMLASKALLEEAPGAQAQSAMELTLNPRDLFSPYVEPEFFNGEIIFIADRSGSMHGGKMNTLKDVLSVFLKSLTEEVYFNIYSFGSKCTSIWPQSQPYTDNNVELAAREISTFTASMGGTEILQPIKEAVQKRIVKKSFTTQIICLTDGEVWEESAVRHFVRDTRAELKDAVRFFALGIGDMVSHRLVEGIGTGGGGFTEVVPVDNRARWEGRVMRMLKGALAPKSYDCEIEFHGQSTKAACSFTVGSSFMQAPYQTPALHPFSRTMIYFLFDKEHGTNLNFVTLKTSTSSGKRIAVEVPVSKATVGSYTVHHLAAKAIVVNLETGETRLRGTMIESETENVAGQELIKQLAISYHITSKWTSFVAVEKRGKEENVIQLHKTPPKRDLTILNKRRIAPIAQSIPPVASAYTISNSSLANNCEEPLTGAFNIEREEPRIGAFDMDCESSFTKACDMDCEESFTEAWNIDCEESFTEACNNDNCAKPPNPALTHSYQNPLRRYSSMSSRNWEKWRKLSFGSRMSKRIVDALTPRSSRKENGPQMRKSCLVTQPQERIPPTNANTHALPIDRKVDYSKTSMALNLHNLIHVQSARGSFELPPYFVEALCPYFSTDILFTLKDMLLGDEEDVKPKLDGTMELLLQTVLAVTWIKLACADDNEIWELLVMKAERWIKKIIGNNRVEKRLYECAEGQWVGSINRDR